MTGADGAPGAHSKGILLLRSTRAAAGAAAVLLSLALTACGDDGGDGDNGDGGSGGEPEAQSGPPSDASPEEFCSTINDESLYEGLDPQNPDPAEFVAAIQGLAGNLEDVGTPEDISADAREGFEISLQRIADLQPEDVDFSSQEDPLAVGLSDEDREKVEAFNEYANETCAEEATPAPE